MISERTIPDFAPAPRRLTVDENDGRVWVIFPVHPKWVYIFPIVMGFLLGAAKLAMAIWIVWFMWATGRKFHVPEPVLPKELRPFYMEIFLSAGLAAACWWAAASYHCWLYRRWGRVPRVLTSSRDGLASSRLGSFRMIEEWWPANEISEIRLKPIRVNLNWTRTVADLYVRLNHGRRLRFRLSSPDPHLPQQIAKQVASALGRALS
jgi:hypothetical protein